MVTARLGLRVTPPRPAPLPDDLTPGLALNNDAVAMARRLGDRHAVGYALNARMHALWGIKPAPERLATGNELGEIADDVGDEFLALHGHMWRVRELLAQGDVDAVNDEIARYEARDGPGSPARGLLHLQRGGDHGAVAGECRAWRNGGAAGARGRRGLQRARTAPLRGAHDVDVVAAG